MPVPHRLNDAIKFAISLRGKTKLLRYIGLANGVAESRDRTMSWKKGPQVSMPLPYHDEERLAGWDAVLCLCKEARNLGTTAGQ
jgi:hypothetical protein